ncbi:MAG: McrC family protein [Xanthomonadales bacterium]|nr:McrC family protein [Xanthomonadales bacterium]
MKQLVTVREHARLTVAETPASVRNAAHVPETAFNWLLEESIKMRGSKAGVHLVELEGRRELRLDNYVGVMESPCGTRIEILPKALEPGDDIEAGRNLLQNMLAGCLDLPLRKSNLTILRTFNAPLTEWIAWQFLQGVEHLVRRGLRFDYHPVQEELRYLRGRMVMAIQLRQPPSRAHFFQVEHDVFDADRSENRLICSALDVVRKRTREPRSWRLAHELAHKLSGVPASRDIPGDFRRWRSDRLMEHYSPVRAWCSLILREQMPLTIVGTQKGHSLLFPMEKVYEQYVGSGLRRWLPPGAKLASQAASQFLTRHQGQNWFQLRPDFLIQYEGRHIVADAKWKLLDGAQDTNEHKYGLSQADFYQLFAYGQKYLNGIGTMYLFYPKTSRFNTPLPSFDFSEQLRLHVVPFDLLDGKPVGLRLTSIAPVAVVRADVV